MAKRRRKGGRRKRKIGLGEIAMVAAAISHASGGALLKNSVTTPLRVSYFNRVSAATGDQLTGAVAGLIGYELARIEANKMHVNPAFGPVRIFWSHVWNSQSPRYRF